MMTAVPRFSVFCCLVLCTITASAQFSTSHDLPFLAGPLAKGDIPSQIGPMLLRLKASDNPLNVGVSNWVDEIHGWNWFTNNPGTYITNSTSGVLFNNGGFNFGAILYNTNGILVSPTNGMVFIFKPLSTSGGNDQPIMAAIGTGFHSFWYGPTYFGAQGGFTAYQQDFSGYHPWAKSGGLALNKTIDVISVGGPDPVQTYTNGITALSFSGCGLITFNCIGTVADNEDNWMSDYIQEIIVYTKSTALTSLNVSNLHYYATNTYGPYAP